MPVATVPLDEGNAFILDGLLNDDVLNAIDAFRESLPLDSKRPTVDRRFFADKGPCAFLSSPSGEGPSSADRPIAAILENAMSLSLVSSIEAPTSSSVPVSPKVRVHVFRYMRFLEYSRQNHALDPHTDGTKVCEDTQLESTHTLLLYLTDCREGGATVLRQGRNTIACAVEPRRGRLLLFPHRCWHEGAPVVDIPKICLRCEVHLKCTDWH